MVKVSSLLSVLLVPSTATATVWTVYLHAEVNSEAGILRA